MKEDFELKDCTFKPQIFNATSVIRSTSVPKVPYHERAQAELKRKKEVEKEMEDKKEKDGKEGKKIGSDHLNKYKRDVTGANRAVTPTSRLIAVGNSKNSLDKKVSDKLLAGGADSCGIGTGGIKKMATTRSKSPHLTSAPPQSPVVIPKIVSVRGGSPRTELSNVCTSSHPIIPFIGGGGVVMIGGGGGGGDEDEEESRGGGAVCVGQISPAKDIVPSVENDNSTTSVEADNSANSVEKALGDISFVSDEEAKVEDSEKLSFEDVVVQANEKDQGKEVEVEVEVKTAKMDQEKQVELEGEAAKKDQEKKVEVEAEIIDKSILV